MKRLIFSSLLALMPVLGFAQDVRLRAGDQVEVRMGGIPADEISVVTGTYTVDGSGQLNLPHVGKVKALGLTQSEMQTAIENAYRSQEIYTHPTVTVSVPQQVRLVDVGGDVRAPRRVEYTPDLTVLGAINAAGGFTEYADQAKVRLLRDGKVVIVNIREVRKDPTKDLTLQPGDKIEVPQSFW